ncbi:hypothetical protein L227DRAFT_580867 [Lentinus tigrinus ALCF2SS1-6]|uniref:Uncharacterized protein n=1 Tax=Lentinus tigrinus ALCF2SS1-6 TaxID=1328759 RepID=A0A5C2RTV6_9APHY|nr:hypothetical protein L227DRAFT_580867 [Lentinus tigrinus ALCF2SS1-6]
MSGRGVPSPCYLSFAFRLSLDTATCWSGRRRDNLAEEQPQSSRAQWPKPRAALYVVLQCSPIPIILEHSFLRRPPRIGWLSPRLGLQLPPTHPVASVPNSQPQSRLAPQLSTGHRHAFPGRARDACTLVRP